MMIDDEDDGEAHLSLPAWLFGGMIHGSRE